MFLFLYIALGALFFQDAATVEGIVMKQGTTDPLPQVSVGLVPEGRGRADGPRATTDDAGKFRFANVSPGRYQLFAERSGFLKGGGPTTLNLNAGQTLKDLRLQLIQPLAITGRVLDESGAPVRGAVVTAMRPAYTAGTRVLRTCQAPQNARGDTNERGEYRLFGLEPGSYYLTVALQSPPVIGPNGGPLPNATCITQYYPAAFDTAEAVPIVLKPGADFAGIDFRLTKPVAYTATLKVQIPPGSPQFPVMAQVMIVRLNRNGIRSTLYFGRVGTFSDDESSYTTPNLPPGSYEIEVGRILFSGIDTGRTRFEIVDRDKDAGTIVAYPPAKVTGQITVEGPMPDGWKLADLGIGFLPLDPKDYYAVLGNRVAADGTFATQQPLGQGRYQPYFSSLNENLYVAAATRNGRDILDGGLFIENDEPIALALTLRAGGHVEGTVRNAKDEPVPDSMVALVPAPNLRGNTMLFKTMPSDQDGRFSFRGVAPGEYTLLAWEDSEVTAGAARNSEFLKAFETRGTRVTMREGLTSSANIRVIPATP